MIQNNRLKLDISEFVQKLIHSSTQKLLKSRFFDHPFVWKKKNAFFITSSKTIKNELLKLRFVVSIMRNNFETIQRKIEAKKHVIMKEWCFILRIKQSWEFFDIKSKNVQSYTYALSVINDFESNYAQLQLHFISLWKITIKINIRFEQLVLKTSKKHFHLESKRRNLIQLQRMYETFNSNAKNIKMIINDVHVIKSKKILNFFAIMNDSFTIIMNTFFTIMND